LGLAADDEIVRHSEQMNKYINIFLKSKGFALAKFLEAIDAARKPIKERRCLLSEIQIEAG